MVVTTLTSAGQTAKTTLTSKLFEGDVNHALLSQVIRVYLSNLRQGTSKTKTRSEINRTKKKWFKQKGTGNARHGARTPSIFVGGGVSHGPNGEQNWRLSLSQTQKLQGLTAAFRSQVGALVIHEGLEAVAAKTSVAQKLLNQAVVSPVPTLVLVSAAKPELVRAFRNIPWVLVTSAKRVTALEIASAGCVLTSPEAIAEIEARVFGAQEVKVAAPEAKKTATKKPAAKKTASSVKKESSAA